MRKIIVLSILLWASTTKAQSNYELGIQKLTSDIVNWFDAKGYTQVGLSAFCYDDKQTKLTKTIYNEFNHELFSGKSSSSKLSISGSDKLNTVKGFTAAASEFEKAVSLGKGKITEYVCFGTISDYEKGYKVLLNVYETRGGNMVSSFKTVIDKLEWMEKLNAEIISSQPIYSQLNAEKPEDNTEETNKKEKKKKDRTGKGQFWAKLGDRALSIGSDYATDVINGTGGKPPKKDSTKPASPPPNTPSPNTPSPTQSSSSCTVNFNNKTDKNIRVTIYEDYQSVVKSTNLGDLTIPPGKSKKMMVKKGIQYTYYAVENNSSTWFPDKEYKGNFWVEKCGEIQEVDIE